MDPQEGTSKNCLQDEDNEEGLRNIEAEIAALLAESSSESDENDDELETEPPNHIQPPIPVFEKITAYIHETLDPLISSGRVGQAELDNLLDKAKIYKSYEIITLEAYDMYLIDADDLHHYTTLLNYCEKLRHEIIRLVEIIEEQYSEH